MSAMAKSTKPYQHRNALQADLLGLSEACPYDHCNPKDCPLFLVRRMPPRDRLRWFNGLGEADLIYLAAYHHVCLNTRLDFRSAVASC